MIERVSAAGLLAPGGDVLVLLSGGRDSVCLLDLAVRICGAQHVRALHINYGLRAGAELDTRFCEGLCESLGVALSVHRPAAGPVGNVQAWARRERYDAARALTDGDVAVGHTASDQVETVLYRLVSSPSRRALLGMRPREGKLIRPLLSVTREETGEWCTAHDLSWRDDPTNDTDRYVRNRIRHEVAPLLAELHPGFSANVLALADTLRAEGEVLDALVDAVLDGQESVTLAALWGQPPPVARLVVQRLADAVLDGAPAAGVARRVDEVLAMGPDAALDLPSGIRAVTAGGVLSFARTPPLER